MLEAYEVPKPMISKHDKNKMMKIFEMSGQDSGPKTIWNRTKKEMMEEF